MYHVWFKIGDAEQLAKVFAGGRNAAARLVRQQYAGAAIVSVAQVGF